MLTPKVTRSARISAFPALEAGRPHRHPSSRVPGGAAREMRNTYSLDHPRRTTWSDRPKLACVLGQIWHLCLGQDLVRVWPRSGDVDRIRCDSAKFGPMLAIFGPDSGKFGRRVRSGLASFGPMLDNIGSPAVIWPALVHILSNLGRGWRQSGQTPARLKIVRHQARKTNIVGLLYCRLPL